MIVTLDMLNCMNNDITTHALLDEKLIIDEVHKSNIHSIGLRTNNCSFRILHQWSASIVRVSRFELFFVPCDNYNSSVQTKNGFIENEMMYRRNLTNGIWKDQEPLLEPFPISEALSRNRDEYSKTDKWQQCNALCFPDNVACPSIFGRVFS